MGKSRDSKVAILPSTTRKGTTLSTSAALDSPSVISQLVSPPQASLAGTSAEAENSHNIDNVSAVLDDSDSLGSFLDATIARSRQIENTETPNAATPVNSPESVDYSSDDPDEDYVELDDDFINRCNATADARKIKKFLTQYTVRYKLSPDPKFATSPICIKDKKYDFSLDLSHIDIVEKTPFCGTEKESAVEHMNELSSMSSLFSDDVKMRTYFVAKNFPFSLKDDAKTWYKNLPPGSIKSPGDLLDVFFRKYFPASAQHAALKIYSFDQEDGEKLPEAWERFCSLIRARPGHDLEKHDLLDIFYSGLTVESRAYLDSCAGCVFRKRTPDEAEELFAKIGRNHDDWTIPEPTPMPILKKRGLIKLNDEDMREAKKSLKEKGLLNDFLTLVDKAGLTAYMGDEREQYLMLTKIFVESFKFDNKHYRPTVAFKIYGNPITMKLEDFCVALGIAPVGTARRIQDNPRALLELYREITNDDCRTIQHGKIRNIQLPAIKYFAYYIATSILGRENTSNISSYHLAFLIAALTGETPYHLGALIARRLSNRGPIFGGIIASHILAHLELPLDPTDVPLTPIRLDIAAMKSHQFVTVDSSSDNLVYRMLFADGDEREIPFPQPDLFSVDRKPWSRSKEEVDEKMKIQGFHQQHDSEDAEPSYDYTVTYPGASSSTYPEYDPSSSYYGGATSWAPWD
ncbi:hypothetical protein QYE76_034380 [Lolium multiflorum]|uniref:Retrotransposon gag domain-containing protein n=1 Tax=Lolium multiflorum TaxID=4521 RepID=A0AAD8QZ33_LOLMU|nr:hypothetical protein QYE76_034380 [Lolium multiflorum]